jgi:hypothetical protein
MIGTRFALAIARQTTISRKWTGNAIATVTKNVRSFSVVHSRRFPTTIHVYQNDSSFEEFAPILADPNLAKEVTGVVFHTQGGDEYEKWQACYKPSHKLSDWEWQLRNREDERKLKHFKQLIESIRRFPNLRSFGLQFNAECQSETNYYSDVEEDAPLRWDILRTAFTALDNASHMTPNLESLSIKNLQNYDDPSLVQSPAFLSTLSRLKELRLNVVTECDEHCPESKFNIPQLYKFYEDFPNTWLKPASQNLESLTIHGDDCWGYMPKCDFRGLHFPKLRKLELANYSISHDWQLDWILSHTSTLEELILNEVTITSYVYNYGTPDPEKYPTNPVDLSGGSFSFEIPAKWSHLFSQFESRLPKLKRFKFGTGGSYIFPSPGSDNSTWAAHFDGEKWDTIGLFERRYQIFNRGIGPSPWHQDLKGFHREWEDWKNWKPDPRYPQARRPYDLFREDYKFEPVDWKVVEIERDQDALDRLMATVVSRR